MSDDKTAQAASEHFRHHANETMEEQEYLLSKSAQATPEITGGGFLSNLVDWVYLHATEGQTWPSSKTAQKLIGLARIKPATQAEADALKAVAPAQPQRVEGATDIIDEAACLIWAELCPGMVMGDEDRSYYEAAAKAVLALPRPQADTQPQTVRHDLLQRARQFVADSGCDEDDDDVNTVRNHLLADIDAALSRPQAGSAPTREQIIECLRKFDVFSTMDQVADAIAALSRPSRDSIEKTKGDQSMNLRHVCRCPECVARGNALQEIAQMPFSMVNDSDSLRHTIRTMQYIASVGGTLTSQEQKL